MLLLQQYTAAYMAQTGNLREKCYGQIDFELDK